MPQWMQSISSEFAAEILVIIVLFLLRPIVKWIFAKILNTQIKRLQWIMNIVSGVTILILLVILANVETVRPYAIPVSIGVVLLTVGIHWTFIFKWENEIVLSDEKKITDTRPAVSANDTVEISPQLNFKWLIALVVYAGISILIVVVVGYFYWWTLNLFVPTTTNPKRAIDIVNTASILFGGSSIAGQFLFIVKTINDAIDDQGFVTKKTNISFSYSASTAVTIVIGYLLFVFTVIFGNIYSADPNAVVQGQPTATPAGFVAMDETPEPTNTFLPPPTATPMPPSQVSISGSSLRYLSCGDDVALAELQARGSVMVNWPPNSLSDSNNCAYFQLYRPNVYIAGATDPCFVDANLVQVRNGLDKNRLDELDNVMPYVGGDAGRSCN